MCIWVRMNKFLTFIALLLFHYMDAFGRNNLVCYFQLNYGRDRNRMISNPAVWAVWKGWCRTICGPKKDDWTFMKKKKNRQLNNLSVIKLVKTSYTMTIVDSQTYGRKEQRKKLKFKWSGQQKRLQGSTTFSQSTR
jgi:hypothetical protein